MAPGALDKLDRRRDLDGLRGVAVLLTILLHYVSRGGYFSYLGPKPVALFLDSFWSGVDVFFVLSGFLIGGIILDHGRAENFLRVFYLRRALRILPVALLAIAFSYLIIPLLVPFILSVGRVPPYAYLLFINNFWTASGVVAYPPLGPMWSLAIEEQFYLIAPAFILLVDPRVRNVALLLVVLVSPLLRMCDLGCSPWDFTPVRLDGFCAGMLVAVLLRDARFVNLATQNRKTCNSIAIGLMMAAPIFASIPELSLRERVAFGVFLNSLAAAGVILFLHLNRESALSRALSRPWLVGTGRISYFLYLMHLPLLAYVAAAGVPRLMQPVVAFGIALVGGRISWRFLESRLIDIGKNASYLPPRASARAGPLQQPGV
jgi:peptidoglycan/LPS O-acetylase OafA/YrhL